MASGFSHLLAPGRIGGLEVPNRIVMPAMDMNQSVEGEISDPEIAHYVARAAGGAGLVIMGAGAVSWPLGAQSREQPGFSDDRFLPGLRRLADAVRAAGGRICAQLAHHAKTARVDIAEGRDVLVPSTSDLRFDLSVMQDNTPDEVMAIAATTAGKVPTYHEADEDDLAWAVDQFAEAAARAQAAGLDAVEIHAGHGYLLSMFLSAGYNHRTDRWGGSLENRARLTCEVVRAVRDRVGEGFPILVRINGHEYGPPGGQVATDAAAAARLIEAAGADAIHVSAMAHDSFADFTEGPLPAEVGQYRELARTVKAAVSIPVVAVGRILPELGEQMIAAGDCDFVAMGRQLLADPELPAKLAAGRPETVRPCISCYVCVEQNFFDGTPRCAVNPALGDEDRTATGRGLPSADVARHVVVVGGGPAGMEAARLARLRGHRVTLLERSTRLGGTAWFSQLTTPANGPLIDWLARGITAAGVDVRLGAAADETSIAALAPDVVLVATGARRGRPDVPGVDLPHVLSGDDLRAMLTGDGDLTSRPGVATRAALGVARLTGLLGRPDRVRSLSRRWMPVGRDVVVVGGGLVGLELAHFLAQRRRRVTVLEDGPNLGLPMAMPRRWAAVGHARHDGVTLHRGARLDAIEPDQVRATVDGEPVVVPATTVVVAGGVEPDTTLADRLRAAGLDARPIGDAASVGYIEGAIHSAWAAVEAL